jgi:LmbE family N-acetylglucosaminyl deacetylase
VSFESILVLGAHPDDEIGCAGSLARFIREGARVQLITFSRCQDLNGPELIDEWEFANSALGVQMSILDLPNRALPEYRQTVISRLDLEKGKHDLILCPSTNDVHQDHSTVVLEARRVFKDTTILGYELPLNHLNGTHNQAYVRLTQADVESKVRHAQHYATQRDEAYMASDYLIGLARVRGVQAETEYAEAFEVIRWVL